MRRRAFREAGIKIVLLTALTMTAFAANSVLNRLALADDAIGPSAFAAIRVVAGAVVLAALLGIRDRAALRLAWPHPAAVAGLASYMVGFSFAYVSLDAGLGALILFGGVQITMFLGALAEGERPPPQRWLGMALALSGLAVLTLPSGPVSITPSALALMGSAAVGWGVYSLIGRRVADPLAATAWSFLACVPIVAVVVLLAPDEAPASAAGIGWAILSGGVASALGYALWYALLPELGATKGALAQLCAPAIALGMGALLLGEAVTPTGILAGALILGGVAVGVSGRALGPRRASIERR